MGSKKTLVDCLGHVYFIRCQVTGLIKIGWTESHPSNRFNALRPLSPTPLEFLGVIRGYLGDENSLHLRFKADRDHGEWFRPSEGLVRYIAEHAKPPLERGRLYDDEAKLVRKFMEERSRR